MILCYETNKNRSWKKCFLDYFTDRDTEKDIQKNVQ